MSIGASMTDAHDGERSDITATAGFADRTDRRY